MRSILPLLFLLLASCASLPTVSQPVVRPLGSVILDSGSGINGSVAAILDVGNGSWISVGRTPKSEAEIIRYDSLLRSTWVKRVSLSEGSELDIAGVHIADGRMYLPVLSPHANDVKEYRHFVFNAANGDSLSDNTLLRLNRNDVGALLGSFWSGTRQTEQHYINPVWSPDSSKILLFKKYGAGSGRISIEMLLYKRGFSLITKNNIDFKLDTTTQSLIDIRIDNDGVAYFFLLNEAEASIEVGRFEILGSKKLRTIKNSSPSIAKSMGSVSVAPRGHAYVALLGNDSAKSVAQLVDFDFYSDRPRMVELATFPPITVNSRNSPPAIVLSPSNDRLIVTYDEMSQSSKITNHLYAFDLDLARVWNYSHMKPQVLMGHHAYPPKTRLLHGAVGYVWTESQSLQWQRVDLAGGTVLTCAPIAKIEGANLLLGEEVIVFGKRIYFSHDKLYRLTLP